MLLGRSRSSTALKVDMQMTSMIDVVFQLLAFFIVSFKIVEEEGDLALKMPQVVEGADASEALLPLRVELRAGQKGELAAINVAGQSLESTTALRAYMLQAVGSPQMARDLQVHLACDPALRYEHVIAALTAVSGQRAGREVMPLAKNVRIVDL